MVPRPIAAQEGRVSVAAIRRAGRGRNRCEPSAGAFDDDEVSSLRNEGFEAFSNHTRVDRDAFIRSSNVWRHRGLQTVGIDEVITRTDVRRCSQRQRIFVARSGRSRHGSCRNGLHSCNPYT